MRKSKLVLIACVLALLLGLNLGGSVASPLKVDPPFDSSQTV